MRKLILCLFSAVFFITCNDPIFFTIHQEEKKLDPKIPGSPTNFVVFRDNLYVASGEKLFIYKGTDPNHSARGLWDEKKPGGKIFELAATDLYLYILSEDKVLRKSSDGTSWAEVLETGGHNILSICSTNNQLFIGAGTMGYLYILNGNTFERLADTGNMLLNGAAYNGTNYYLIAKNLISEKGGGIYTGSLTTDGMYLIGDKSDIPFIGIINLENTSHTIVAIDQSGQLYNVPSLENSGKRLKKEREFPATGALTVWENESREKLLLAGRQDVFVTSSSSGYTYGYMELIIEDEGGVTGIFDEPGIHHVSTVNDNDKYKTSLGAFPVNHIIQTPILGDDSRIIFASTQKEGVYSYRQRGEEKVWSWNAEQAE